MQKTWYRQGADLLKEIHDTKLSDDTLAFWYLGQCGFVFKKSATVYIDPVLNDITDDTGETRRLYSSPFSPGQVQADYVLCTHGHLDHLALDTLTAIAAADSHTVFIVPGACVSILTEAGISSDRIMAANAHHTLVFPGLTIKPVSAAHPVHMTDNAGNDTALCYYLIMDGIRLLHMGDTYLTDQLLNDLQALPVPHLFFPPINGGDYFRTARDCIGNLSYIESAHLAVLLHADMTVPTHYDMIMGNTIDPTIFLRAPWMQNSAAKTHIPMLGERFFYHL